MGDLSQKQLSAMKKEFSAELAHFTDIWNVNHSRVRVDRSLPNGLIHELDSPANTDGYCLPYSALDSIINLQQDSDSSYFND